MIKPVSIIGKCALYFTLFAMIIVVVPSATAAFKYLREGMTAPDVEGSSIIDGKQVSTKTIPENNMLIIVFWASWSKRSMDQLNDMKEIALKYQDLPLTIIAVNVESQHISEPMEERLKQISGELGLPFPVMIDYGLKIFRTYGVIAVPSTAIVDTTGVLRYGPAGYSLTTRDLIIDSIEVLLGLKQADIKTVVMTGYRPKDKASRYYNLALQLTGKRMYERALSNLELAQSADEKFAGPHLLRGEIFLRLDSLTAAGREFKIAVDLDSGLVPGWAGWGRSLYLQKKADSAFEALLMALRLDSSYTPALLDYSLCLSERNQVSEALDSLFKVRELNQMEPMVHYYLGQIYIKNGDTASAAESFKAALQLLYPAK